MSNSLRKQWETATTLDQDYLDAAQDNLLNKLEVIVDIEAPPLIVVGAPYTTVSGSIIEITAVDHALCESSLVLISNASDSNIDSFRHVTKVVNKDVFWIDTLTTPSPASGTLDVDGERCIRASDRNKYVVNPITGEGFFYEALLVFPVIRRTVGEFLSPTLEFSSLELTISNVDGRFNGFLPEGPNFDGWVGNNVVVKLGLAELSDSYTTIFEGQVTDQGGFKRSVSSITLVARDKFEAINKTFPSAVFDATTYPNLEEGKENSLIPVVYGDWTTQVEPNLASLPAIPVNGEDPTVNGDTSNVGNVEFVMAAHPVQAFDTTEVYLRRGERAWKIASADIVNVLVGTSPSVFEIKQNSLNMTAVTPDTATQVLLFGRGDEFFIKAKGKDLGAYDDNIIAQSQDVLTTYGGVNIGSLDANWATLRDKAAPAESAISTFKSRIYINEPQNVLEFTLSLLEQVRIEAFIDRSLKLKLFPLHLDEFEASPSHTVRNWDVEQASFQPRIDDRTNFNRAQGVFNFLPNRRENLQETSVHRNQAAIDQAGREISKKIVFPNLYEAATVKAQLIETLRITSAYIENVDLTLTWRSLLLDIGDFVKLNVRIQSSEFSEVPAVIREIGYDPAGIKLPMRLWSFQMLPFTGYNPGNPGTVGGSTAILTDE